MMSIVHLRTWLLNVRCVALLLTVLIPAILSAQGGTEVVRGRVLTEAGEPMANVTVVVTGLLSRIERKAKTNKDGLYNTFFTQGDGEYVVSARAMGYVVQRKRVVRSSGNVLVADLKMAIVSAQLDTVVVKGEQSGVPRKKGAPSVGSNERDVLTEGALFSLDPSDLTSLMRGTPGLMLLPGSKTGELYSALGASPNQNSTLADGGRFTGARLPIEGIQSVTMATTTFDASRGNFAGGQMQITTRSGTNNPEASLTTSLEHPTLAVSDPKSIEQGYRTQSWGGSLSGPIKKNKAFYSASFETRRHVRPLRSLLNFNRPLMNQYGLIRDTINAVGSALQSLGVPTTTAAVSDEGDRMHSYLFRADVSPTATTTLVFRVNGSTNENGGLWFGVSGYPSIGSASSNKSTGWYASTSTYFGKILNELSVTYGVTANGDRPYAQLPHGTVLVGALYPDGRTGLSSLLFGGNLRGRSRTSSEAFSFDNQTSFLTTDTKHQVKVATQLERTNSTTKAIADQLGLFTYQSLTDLQQNRPSSYSRTFSAQDRSSGATTLSFSLGDTWRTSNVLSFEYGLRLDLASTSARIAYNPLVDSVFGYRTDHVPHDVGVSPRFGFNWMQSEKSARGPERVEIRGGVGAFKGVLRPDEIASLVDATGLPNTIRQLNCVGAATPEPLWSQYASGTAGAPEQCLDGTAPVIFSTDKPAVRLYDPAFRSPLSWRASLIIGGLNVKGWKVLVNSDYSIGVNDPSVIDLNLRRTPVFTLPTEGRPLYVAPDAIVPTTGAIAPGASRIDDRFSTVNTTVSDLKTTTTQVTANFFRMNQRLVRLPLNVSYTLTRSFGQSRGLGLDPFTPNRFANAQPTHQFKFSTSVKVWWASLSTRLELSSGTPYTPFVNADINGDGQARDPAFVFNPANVSDPTLKSELSALLASSSSARNCLRAQFGSIAGINSCRTGWHLLSDFNIGLSSTNPQLTNPGKTFGSDDRLSFSITTQNAMSLMFRTLGLSNTSIGRTMIGPTLDPILYYVDGFDPVTHAFQYRVNQQFGETNRRLGGGRAFQPPFQVILGGRLKVGGASANESMLAQSLHLIPADGEEPYTREQIQVRLRGLTANPAAMILKMSDQLLLTEAQVAKMTQADSAFSRQVDTLYAPVASYVLARGRKVTDAELMKRVNKVNEKVMKAMKVVAKEELIPLLTKEQQGKLPSFLKDL